MRLKELEVKGQEEGVPARTEIINFRDEKGVLQLSIKKDSLLYLESADNYVSVWYLSKSGVSNYLVRNTLKEMELRFSQTRIVRCHRSYLVNLDQVKVARRTSNGIVLDLGTPKIPDIPVSRTHAEQIARWFTNM